MVTERTDVGKPRIRIAHLSDLHFTVGSLAKELEGNHTSQNHRHSNKLLVEAEKTIMGCSADYLVVSGDISNNGDVDSLVMAENWLLRRMGIGGGDDTGLEFEIHNIGLVPGNHDAWNSHKTGKYRVRWQRSLDNYNKAFHPRFKMNKEGIWYDWLERSDINILLLYLDSSYFGSMDGTPRSNVFSKIARGKISVGQSERLMQIYDQGLNGNLPMPRDSDLCIDRARFRDSLKIAVMHHYLFNPPGSSDSYFMQLKHRDVVLRNFIMSGVDVVLCGHKHIPYFANKACGDHLDRRAKKRYMLNVYRRCLGLHGYPLQFRDANGKWMSRSVSWIAQLFASAKKPRGTKDWDELIARLVQGIEDTEVLKALVAEFDEDIDENELTTFPAGELEEIAKYIASQIPKHSRKLLSKSLGPLLKNKLERLKQRRFMQSMAGSTAKRYHNSSPSRSLHIYDIYRGGSGNYQLDAARYQWDEDSSVFEHRETVPYVFNRIVP